MCSDIYVSPQGKDSNPGTKDAPVATLMGARARLRELRAAGKVVEGGLRVTVREGTYVLDKTFVLAPQDTASEDAPLTIAAERGATVRLIGGRVLDAKHFTTITDAGVLDRLPAAARQHVLQCDLTAAGITDFGKFTSRGFSRKPKPAHLELYFGDKPMTVAQWPNKGQWTNIASIPENAGGNDGHGTTLGKLDAGFHYEGDRPRQWRDTRDVWVHGYWAYDWANSYEHIASIDHEKRHIVTDGDRGLYGYKQGQRFCFVNVLEELDEAGEYFVDSQRGMLYFWPPAPIDSAECVASVLEKPLIETRDVSYVTFEGFDLGYCRGHAVKVISGDHVTLRGCTIRHVGNDAARIEGGTKHGLEDCHVYDTGDGGVHMTGGDRATLEPAGHFVTACHFHDQARWSRCYFPAVYSSGVGHHISHNLIHDHPHCAILYEGNEHVIEFNEIHHTCWETGDVGAIYTGRDWSTQGNIIRHNYLHHISGPGHLGAMAVYLDDCVSGTTVYGNVIAHTQVGVLVGGGRDITIANNIFYDCKPAIHFDERGVSPSPVWQDMVNKTMKDRLEAVNHHQPPYSTRYPQLQSIDAYLKAGKGVPPGNDVIENNICVNSEWLRLHMKSNDGQVRIEGNLLDIDPRFVDAEAGDFNLRHDSPALAAGFRAIPFDDIGLPGQLVK
jgi:hypothetical protein